MRIIGLTGGMGSGKSTVGARLREWGVPVIDADRIAREVVDPGKPALRALIDHFSDAIVDERGALRRDELARLVFESDEERRALESIVHPAIASETQRQMAALKNAGEPLVVYEAPLLFEVGREGMCDEVVAVIADEAVQLERIRARGGVDNRQARARIAAQLPQSVKAERADVVLENSGSMDALLERVDSLVAGWRARGWLPAGPKESP